MEELLLAVDAQGFPDQHQSERPIDVAVGMGVILCSNNDNE